jgi:hypothetical protein
MINFFIKMSKKNLIKIAALAAVTLSVIAAKGKEDKAEKVKVLHKGKVITISANALNSHLKHGDELMVFHEGEWITQTELDAILAEHQEYQDATAEDEEFEGDEDFEEDAEEL